MKWIRRLHAWIGVLFAPSIVLFALSGLLQMYGAHEGEGAAGWAQRLGQIHMKQTASLPPARGPRPGAPPAAHAADDHAAAPDGTAHAGDTDHAAAPPAEGAPKRASTLPLKLFFTLMSIGLIVSTCLGVYMAFTPKRDRTLLGGLLAAGIVLPILLLMV